MNQIVLILESTKSMKISGWSVFSRLNSIKTSLAYFTETSNVSPYR